MYLNIQGLAGNVNLLETVAVNDNLDVICLAEPWLNNVNLNLACLPECSVAASFCRANKLRGGSVIFIKSNVTYKPVPAISSLAAQEVFEVSACIVEDC